MRNTEYEIDTRALQWVNKLIDVLEKHNRELKELLERMNK